MGACASRDATAAPSASNSSLPPTALRDAAYKSSIDLSQPRSSPPSTTHPPLPSTTTTAPLEPSEPTDPSTAATYRPRAPTLVSQSRAGLGLALGGGGLVVLPATVEVRAEREVVWALHGEGGAADGAVLDVVGGEDGELFTAGLDKCVLRFDWQRRSVRDRWKAHSMPVERLLYCHHSHAVFTASRDSNIRMFSSSSVPSSSPTISATAPNPMAPSTPPSTDIIFRGHTLSVSALCFDSLFESLNGAPCNLISGGRDYSLRWWDIETQKQLDMRIQPNNIVTALSATYDPAVLLSANAAGIVHQWDNRTHDLVHTFTANNTAPVVSLSAHPSSPLFLVAHSPANSTSPAAATTFPTTTSSFRLYDLRNTAHPLRLTPLDEPLIAAHLLPTTTGGSGLAAAAVRCVTVSAGGQVRMWLDGECVSSARVRGDSGVVRCASMGSGASWGVGAGAGAGGADDRNAMLYTGSTDGNVCVWNVRDGNRLAVKMLIRSRMPQ